MANSGSITISARFSVRFMIRCMGSLNTKARIRLENLPGGGGGGQK